MTNLIDTTIRRGVRDRCAAEAVLDALPLLTLDERTMLERWTRTDSERRSRTALLSGLDSSKIELAENLCECLLQHGWIARRERLVSGTWQWEAITWCELQRLQALLGVSSPKQRIEQRQMLIEQANGWLGARKLDDIADVLDPDMLDELSRAIEQLSNDKGIRLSVLSTRLELVRAVAAWHDQGVQGTRRDFALAARGATKAITNSDWCWLETTFDLERLRVERFAPVGWLAGDFVLRWGDVPVHLKPLHCLGLPLADLALADSVSHTSCWWLIENRASFERQARKREPGIALVWMPGRPSSKWFEAIHHLLRLAPAPARISADADPAGVDIACTVGKIWQDEGLSWEPFEMGLLQWSNTTQRWPLNEHDYRLLGSLLSREDLPTELRGLCDAMLTAERKAEQEAWL